MPSILRSHNGQDALSTFGHRELLQHILAFAYSRRNGMPCIESTFPGLANNGALSAFLRLENRKPKLK